MFRFKTSIAPLVAGCMTLFAGIAHAQSFLWNSEVPVQPKEEGILCHDTQPEEETYFVSCNGFF